MHDTSCGRGDAVECPKPGQAPPGRSIDRSRRARGRGHQAAPIPLLENEPRSGVRAEDDGDRRAVSEPARQRDRPFRGRENLDSSARSYTTVAASTAAPDRATQSRIQAEWNDFAARLAGGA